MIPPVNVLWESIQEAIVQFRNTPLYAKRGSAPVPSFESWYEAGYKKGADDVIARIDEILEKADIGNMSDENTQELEKFVEEWQRVADYKASGNPAYENVGIGDAMRDLSKLLTRLA